MNGYELVIAGKILPNGDPSGLQFYKTINVDENGNILTILSDGSGNNLVRVNFSDSANNTRNNIPVDGRLSLFNGTTWDRHRANTEETFLVSAARTATVNSADFTNFNAKGLHAVINVTSITASPSIVPFIQGKDPVSGTYYDILEGLPITTVGANLLKVYPGIGANPNKTASDILPRTYRLRVTHLNVDNITYSVAGALVI